MSDKHREAIESLVAAYMQQRNRRPLKDSDTIAVYYGDLRKLVEAIAE